MKTNLRILFLIILIATGFAEDKKDDTDNKIKEAEKVIRNYYDAYSKWDHKKLVGLYHADFKEGMSKVMKIKVEDFDKTMLNNLKEGMKMVYKNHEDYKAKNKFKIDDIKIEEAEEEHLFSVVTVSGLMHGIKSSGKMVFILKKNEKGVFKIKDMAKYDRYMKFIKQQELEEEKKEP